MHAGIPALGPTHMRAQCRGEFTSGRKLDIFARNTARCVSPRLLPIKPPQKRIARAEADRLFGVLNAPIRPSQIIVRLAQECRPDLASVLQEGGQSTNMYIAIAGDRQGVQWKVALMPSNRTPATE
jgi:hypothetical protein